MFLLFDIGGTRTRMAASTDLEKFSKPLVFDTPTDVKEFTDVFQKNASTLSPDGFKAGAGGLPGVLDKKTGRIVNFPNLPAWNGTEIKADLSNKLNTEISLENDADIVGIGEAVYGAGRGYKIVSYITISTGVGGTRIVDGKLDVSAQGFEPGHQIIDMDATTMPNVKPKVQGLADVEDFISGSSLEARFGHPEEIFDSQSDRYLYVRQTAVFLNNIIVHWSPEIVVLGGGVALSPKFPLSEIKHELGNILKVFEKIPETKLSELGDESGLWGAMNYLRGKV